MSEWSEEDQEVMEQYLDGSLSPEDKADLEKKLEVNDSFRQQIEILRELREGIREVGRNELLNEMKEWEKESAPLEKPVIPIWKQSWAIGIAALLIIGASTILFWPKENVANDLFAQYFEPYPNVVMPTVRGADNENSTTIQKAYSAYDKGDFAVAALLFEKIAIKDEATLLYLGISYLAIDHQEKAIFILENLLNDKYQFTEEARWYLGLAYLAQGNNVLAKNEFNIIKNNERYKQRITEILKSISSN